MCNGTKMESRKQSQNKGKTNQKVKRTNESKILQMHKRHNKTKQKIDPFSIGNAILLPITELTNPIKQRNT